jgi:ABC-type phosphate transport system substrate-binding protein
MKLVYSAVLALVIVGAACTPTQQQGTTDQETALSGNVAVICDPDMLTMLEVPKRMYDSVHPNAKVTLVPMDVDSAMLAMLNHEQRAAIVARDYTEQELLLRQQDPGDTLMRTLLARDAIVVIADSSFPYDTMNAGHVARFLLGDASVVREYPKLKRAPVFVLARGVTGSMYANVVQVVTAGKAPSRSALTSVSSYDSVSYAVRKEPVMLGLGYLSQVTKDRSVKAIRLSYTNAQGDHEFPKPVHVSYLIMGKYPFPVPVYIYLKDRPNQFNLPSGFMQYMTRNGDVMKAILASGIEPGYGKFSLTLPD